MKLALQTDFRDYYDHWFDRPPGDYVLYRESRQGLKKRNQFELLSRVGFSVPVHGLVQDVCDRSPAQHLVVYDDELSHRGEGKRLCSRVEAFMTVPLRYCSIFIPTTEVPFHHAKSRRLLAIGNRMFWLEYESKGSWQSNHAEEVNVRVTSETLPRKAYAQEGDHNFSELDAYPIFAIDFVYSLVRRQLLAIDFNSAPGLKHTGIEDYLSAQDVFRQIQEFVEIQRIRHHNYPSPTTIDLSIL